MSSTRSNEHVSRPRSTGVPLSALSRLGSAQRPGATSRRSNYNDDRSQILLFRPKGPDSPPEFDPTVTGSNVTPLSAPTSTIYTHATLPAAATADLIAATIAIDDLRHMEAMYDANRKRQFQALVRRYMNQLLHGCDREGVCTVPTCWTARKRLAGSGGTAGVGQGRKLTVLSARIMACTLASRDNPYEGLCDGKPVEVGLAVRDCKKPDTGKGMLKVPTRSPAGTASGGSTQIEGRDGEMGSSGGEEKEHNVNKLKKHGDTIAKGKDKEGPRLPKSLVDSGAKDTKSFTQMLFDTRPLRMLEWLSIPPPLSNFRLSPVPTGRERSKATLSVSEIKNQEAGARTLVSQDSFSKEELLEADIPDFTEEPSKTTLDESSKTLMFPPSPELPIRSPTPPSPAVHKRRETLHEVVTPTPHSNQRRAGASQDPPQTPIAPPPIHLPQRQHRRERPAYEPPQTHYHQSQFTEHFYGLPPPQQTPSRLPSGSASKQMDFENPFGSLTPTDLSPSRTPDLDTDSLNTELSISPPQTLSHLHIGLILSLVKLCIDGEIPAAKHAEADMFARQSVFYCLSNPAALMESFGSHKLGSSPLPEIFDIDPLTTDKAFRIMAWKWENTVLKSLWKGLEEVYKYKPDACGNEAKGVSTLIPNHSANPNTNSGKRQHLLDDYTATYIIIMSMHALAAMLPREGSYLPRACPREEEWLAMRMLRGRGLVTVDIGDCFENELAERLMKRVVRALDYRIRQASKTGNIDDEGEVNPVARLLVRYMTKCANAEIDVFKGEDTAEDIFGVKKEKSAKNWSVAGCMLEWARAVLLKDWDGNEIVKKGTVTAGALGLLKLLREC